MQNINPHKVTKDFESALCEYTGSPYAVAVTSCTMALLLACAYNKVKEVTIPKRTYVSVPMSIIHAGGTVKFDNRDWRGAYRLRPYPIYDSARWFTSEMFYSKILNLWRPNDGDERIFFDENLFKKRFICVSFHWSKILGIGQGGAILHNDPEADKWFRKARFDGRTEGVAPKDDTFDSLGWHCYMSPRDSAEGLSRLALLPKDNEPLPNDPYPDLETIKLFK